MKMKIFKKKMSVWTTILLLVSAVALTGGVMALVINSIDPELLSVFSGETTDSDFVIETLDVQLKGKNKLTITLTVTNTDTLPHEAEVIVQLLDTNGDILEIDGSNMEKSKDTGVVNGGETSSSLKFNFEGTDVVSEYTTHFIQINQAS